MDVTRRGCYSDCSLQSTSKHHFLVKQYAFTIKGWLSQQSHRMPPRSVHWCRELKIAVRGALRCIFYSTLTLAAVSAC
jgi:hypothetical protein